MVWLVDIFKKLIDMVFIVVDGVYNFTFNLDGHDIVFGDLIFECGIVFYILYAIFTLLGIAKSIPDDEEE